MKAWVLSKNGIDNLNLKEIDRPKLKPGEVLVKVKAIGLNPIDSMVIDLIPVKSEIIPGAEFAGEREEVGEEVKKITDSKMVDVVIDSIGTKLWDLGIMSGPKILTL